MLPAALPEILVGCRIGLVLALITMVTSEMIARQTGVGNILFNSLDMAQYDTVYAVIVIIGALGFVLDFAFERLRVPAGRLGRAGARHRRGNDMTVRSTPLGDALVGLLPIALVIGLWHVLATTGVAPPSLLPAPEAVFRRLAEQLGSLTYLEHAATTLFRLSAGFGIAVVIGIALGAAVTGSRTVAAGLMPLVRVLAPMLRRSRSIRPSFSRSASSMPRRSRWWRPTRHSPYCLRPIRARRRWSRSWLGGAGHRGVAAALPVHGGAAGRLAVGSDRLPGRPRHLLHRGLSRRDDHVDRRSGHLLVRAARSFQTVDMFVPLITISLLGLLLNAAFNALRRRLLIGFPEEK